MLPKLRTLRLGVYKQYKQLRSTYSARFVIAYVKIMPGPTLRALLSGTFLQRKDVVTPVLGVWPEPSQTGKKLNSLAVQFGLVVWCVCLRLLNDNTLRNE